VVRQESAKLSSWVRFPPWPHMNISSEITKLKQRNRRVEADKAWEISWSRKIVIAILTYVVIVIFFLITKLPNPFINSLVAAFAFVLSTLTIGLLKKLWLNYIYKK
jgi:polyferredoxin